MDMNSLMYRNCDICGEAVSIGRNVCPRCCKEYGTVKIYIRTRDRNVRDALDRIRKKSERSRKHLGGNLQ